MTVVRSQFVVHAPIARVFRFVEHPPNFTRMWPAMERVFDVAPSPLGGFDWRWSYRMLGFRIQGLTTIVEHVAPKLIAMHSDGGGLTVEHAWQFEAHQTGETLLLLDMQFILPAQWLTGLATPLLARENRQQVAIAMGNLRRALEATP